MHAERNAVSNAEPIDADRLLEGLTDPQREAVTHGDGPMLVLAGAGSGKTRVITRRAAYLASTVTQPWHILAISFTNKASAEMRERIAALGVGREIAVCTFHSLCARLLRIHHEAAGLAPNFTIVDQDDRRKLVKVAIERADLSSENFKPASVEASISRAKSAMLSPVDLAEEASGFYEETVARVYGVYETVLAEQQAVDFDDLLMKMACLLADEDAVRAKLADRYRYLLVDEYQDTNVTQYQIARWLTLESKNLFVTGDPDQSIYGWRGADIGNILSFEKDYPGAGVVRLEQNYRSTKRILSAADALISQNDLRKEKSLWTENAEGCAVRVVTCDDGQAEARAVADDLAEQVAAGRSLNDCAVFYRINALSRPLEEACFKAGIGYRIARGLAFYARKEIKDVLAYLRVMVNPADSVSLVRIIGVPARGIGKTTIDRLKGYAADHGCTLFEAVGCASKTGLNKRAVEKLGVFAAMMETLRSFVEGSPREAVEQTLRLTGLSAMLRQDELGNADAIANVDELVSAAAEFERATPDGNLLDWLTFTSLVSDDDVMAGEQQSITLMTLHAAKGLEFPVVYVVGVEDGLLPFRRMGDSSCDEEEERRLLFVGMTRAKERLTISCARRRMLHGMSLPTARSAFLDELPKDEVEWIGLETSPNGGGSYAPAGELPEDIAMWEMGTLVRHPTYGLGQITDMQRGARRTHVRVHFKDGVDRGWVLEFANLKRVDFDDVG